MLPDHLKNKHFFFVVSTNYLSCFNDYGGGKKYLHAGLLWSANLGKDGWILQRGHTDRDQPCTGATLLSESTSKPRTATGNNI